MKIVTQTIILIIFTVYGLTSCDNTKQTSTEQSNTTADTNLTTTINSDQSTINAETNLKATTNQEITIDTIQNDQVYRNYKATFWTTGKFPGNYALGMVGQKKWFGIFENETGCYIAETKIKLKRVIESFPDDTAGWEVQTTNNSGFLIAGLDFLSDHKIQLADLAKNEIFPDDTLKFNYLGVDYKIYATGGRDELIVWNYNLYLTANKNGQFITELLVAAHRGGGRVGPDEMINIIFAGDIDGDGLLDLIIDTSNDQAATVPTLYLSKPADKGHLLKVVGQYSSIAC